MINIAKSYKEYIQKCGCHSGVISMGYQEFLKNIYVPPRDRQSEVENYEVEELV